MSFSDIFFFSVVTHVTFEKEEENYIFIGNYLNVDLISQYFHHSPALHWQDGQFMFGGHYKSGPVPVVLIRIPGPQISWAASRLA